MNNTSHQTPLQRKPGRFKLTHIAGGVLLAAVLTLAFIGHLTPSMKVQWANFMSMCGF